MKQINLFLICSFVLFAFTACNTKNHEKTSPLHEDDFSQLDLSPSKKAIDELQEIEEISNVHAVNNDKNLLIVFTTDSLDRIQLENIEKKAKKHLKKEIKDHKIHLSTDEKLVLEMEQLNAEIDNESITKKELDKDVDHLIKLSKEQT